MNTVLQSMEYEFSLTEEVFFADMDIDTLNDDLFEVSLFDEGDLGMDF